MKYAAERKQKSEHDPERQNRQGFEVQNARKFALPIHGFENQYHQ
jgi:hypothetical protein